MVPTVFRWEHGGEEVYLTGTFTGWKEHRPMHRSDVGEQVCASCGGCRDVQQGQHAFKFIVDGHWRWDPGQDTVADGGQNINNFIDVTGFVRDDAQEQEELASDDEDYGCSIPSGDQYTKEPPLLPPQLRQILLNMPQSSTPSVIPHLPEPTHVTLDHLYCTAIKDGLMVQGMTQRFRRKCTTTVFYSVLPTPSVRPSPALRATTTAAEPGEEDPAAFAERLLEETTRWFLQEMLQSRASEVREEELRAMQEQARWNAHAYLMQNNERYAALVQRMQPQGAGGGP